MCVVGIKFSFKDGFADYCSPEKTGAIRLPAGKTVKSNFLEQA